MTGLTDDQRSNFRLMKDVATYTKITPNQRHAAFKKYIENVLANETARNRLKGWGLSLAPETINITARTLDPETLYFGNNIKVPGKPNADWNGDISRNPVMQAVDILRWAILFTDRDKQVANVDISRNPVMQAVDILRWAILFTDRDKQVANVSGAVVYRFSSSREVNADWNGDISRNPVMQAVDILRWAILFTDRDKQVANDFMETIKRCSRPMGINVQNPDMVRLPNDRTEAYISGLKKSINSELQLVVAICPTARDDRYAAIKKVCCAECPIPSQVINARTLMNQAKIRSITQKILLQMNCKLGGTLWSIAIPFKTAMIVGIDSYHDAARKSRSVCSFIASYNQSMTQWYSRAIFQERGQEVVDGLKSCLVDALTHYLRTNGKLPDRVIMYRDGVGDGQLNTIKQYEIPQMQVCFSLMEATYKPTLTYIVVQKRINTRIFMKVQGGFENPHPGTVLDHDITRRDWYDFLIASQKVNQGTVTPTHYVVVHDDSAMTPDQCQRLTYKLCHLYYNWPGTVRVPAPCQYAHKLAFLIGQNVHEQPSDKLADKLYFL
ncbi:piwi domain-containing protein [Phthorimaea operculella]|nr:piwi domain-containing protein [Phthorimaea operculella]